MDRDLILLPIGAMAALTFTVLLLIPIARFASAAKGQVKRDDFKFGESANVPGNVSIPNRNYMNLLELPVLFYVLCLMMYVTDGVTPPLLQLAWAYVAVRALHSFVHVTYNNVLHRLILFAVSNFVLISMWVMFFLNGRWWA